METVLKSAKQTVVISPERPTVLIGERINPTGKKRLAAELVAGNLEVVRREALEQVDAGADVLDVNVGAAGVDELDLLPRAVRLVMETVDAPVCIDSANAKALRAALDVHKMLAPEGKPLINSVNGEEDRLEAVLPLVAEYKTAVIGLTMDDAGIPTSSDKRLAIAHKIVERAAAFGIEPCDIVIDCLALTVGADAQAALATLDTIRRVRAELGVNMALGASNVSFGLPCREVINWAFLSMVIQSGVTCPIVDVAKVRPAVLATDLLLGRDEYAMRYISDHRKRAKAAAASG
ncbi:MAG: dihydropteroate synthase [Anaerolineales bacterium]|nr:dihydropteroate synthase [Anaerolineales bacterium]